MGLFGPTRFLDPDVEDWCFETWGWLGVQTRRLGVLQAPQLVTPSREFFPPTETQGRERAQFVFDIVKTHMGLADWPCELEEKYRTTAGQRAGLLAKLRGEGEPDSAFRFENGRAVITYASDLVDEPVALIAVFARELGHYLLARIREAPPGGRDLLDVATELAVAYAGFGVFGAVAAFDLEKQQGPLGPGFGVRQAGRLSQPAWAFALALFATLHAVEVPESYLKPGIADALRKAQRYLKRNEALLAPLRKAA